MKFYKLIPFAFAIPLLTNCDGESSEDKITEELEQITQRGLDITAINNNPTLTPGFPYSLEGGETITFIPAVTEADGFLADIPLGTWEALNSGFLRQGSITSGGGVEFPIDEDSFRYYYETPSATSSSSVSNASSATIYTSYQQRLTNTQFDQALEPLLNGPGDPGSLRDILATDTQDGTTADPVILDALSSVGIPAADGLGYQEGVLASRNVNDYNSSVFVRHERYIYLSGITSTNADLSGSDPIITGEYSVYDDWNSIVRYYTEVNGVVTGGSLELRYPSENDWITEIQTGSFIIRLNQLEKAN